MWSFLKRILIIRFVTVHLRRMVGVYVILTRIGLLKSKNIYVLMKNVENILKPALKNIVPKNCNYADKIRIENIKQLLIDYTSLEKISEKIHSHYGCKPCRQTILNHKKNEKYENHYKEKIEKTLKYFFCFVFFNAVFFYIFFYNFVYVFSCVY